MPVGNPFNVIQVYAYPEGPSEPVAPWVGPFDAQSNIYQVEPLGGELYVQRTANWQVMDAASGDILRYVSLSTGFDTINDFTIDRERNQIVCVTGQQRVRVASLTGTVVASSSAANFPTQYTGAVAVDRSSSAIYATYYDGSAYKLRRFSPDLAGGVQAEWTIPSQPRGLAADGGRVYVASEPPGIELDGRITIYTDSGTLVDTWGYDGTTNADNLWTPTRLTIDSDGDVYADSGYGAVRRYTNEGAYLTQYTHTHDNQQMAVKGLSEQGGRLWFSITHETPGNTYNAIYGMAT